MKRKRLIERHGNSSVISKHWCLVVLGLLLYAAGVLLFLWGPIGRHFSIRTPGAVLALGTACLILSNFVKD